MNENARLPFACSQIHTHTHTILWLYSYALWPVNQGQNHYGLLNDRDFTSICKPEVTFEVSPSVPSIPGDELSSWKLDSTALTIHSCVCISLIPFYASNHRCGLEFTFLYSQKYTHTQLWMRGIDWSTSACVLIHLARLVAYMFFFVLQCLPLLPTYSSDRLFWTIWSFLSCTKTFIRSLRLYLCRFSVSLRNNKIKNFPSNLLIKQQNNREWIIRKKKRKKISPSRVSSN